jgi:hypothetical protein
VRKRHRRDVTFDEGTELIPAIARCDIHDQQLAPGDLGDDAIVVFAIPLTEKEFLGRGGAVNEIPKCPLERMLLRALDGSLRIEVALDAAPPIILSAHRKDALAARISHHQFLIEARSRYIENDIDIVIHTEVGVRCGSVDNVVESAIIVVKTAETQQPHGSMQRIGTGFAQANPQDFHCRPPGGPRSKMSTFSSSRTLADIDRRYAINPWK